MSVFLESMSAFKVKCLLLMSTTVDSINCKLSNREQSINEKSFHVLVNNSLSCIMCKHVPIIFISRVHNILICVAKRWLLKSSFLLFLIYFESSITMLQRTVECFFIIFGCFLGNYNLFEHSFVLTLFSNINNSKQEFCNDNRAPVRKLFLFL